MWISNSAATSIMIPAAVAIIDEVENYHKQMQQQQQALDTERGSKDIATVDTTVILDFDRSIIEQKTTELSVQDSGSINRSDLVIESTPSNNQATVNPDATSIRIFTTQVDYRQLKSGFLIAVAYSSGLGGLITLVGTGTNIFTKGFVDEFYATGAHAFKITFSNFLLFGLPVGVIMLILCCLWLQILYNRRDYVTDGTTAILIGSLPLILPDQNPFQENWTYKPILEWNQLSKSFPWGVFMLQGAGLAIADGFKSYALEQSIVYCYCTHPLEFLIYFILFVYI
ncbi:unnamed protein product [Rotaria sp. Silwood2]|nr:unnamed protein product [Rotaria sp. Silwood2]